MQRHLQRGDATPRGPRPLPNFDAAYEPISVSACRITLIATMDQAPFAWAHDNINATAGIRTAADDDRRGTATQLGEWFLPPSFAHFLLLATAKRLFLPQSSTRSYGLRWRLQIFAITKHTRILSTARAQRRLRAWSVGATVRFHVEDRSCYCRPGLIYLFTQEFGRLSFKIPPRWSGLSTARAKIWLSAWRMGATVRSYVNICGVSCGAWSV